MLHFRGKGVYGAIAIGKAAVFRRRTAEICRTEVADTERERERFLAARARAVAELRELYGRAVSEVGETDAQIFEIHVMMLEDEDYGDSIVGIIESERVNAEYAAKVTGERFARTFGEMEDDYMQARAADIRDVTSRLLSCFEEGGQAAGVKGKEIIVCADDLAPSETVLLDKESVLAFVTEEGTQSSHTAILARNMNIPAVIGVGRGFLSAIEDGMTMTVDGYSGEVTVMPSEAALAEAKRKQEKDLKEKALLEGLRGKDNVTLDGRRIDIFANIGSAESVDAVLRSDAGGIGLFRSEFSYLERGDYPSEEELFSAYKRILERMGGRKVVIRTLDIGADKQVEYFGLEREENPALGLRAVRLYLTRPEVFRTQMRALYRASVYGRLAIMFPMITGVAEVQELLRIADGIKQELRGEGIAYSEEVELGIMIETPAAAIVSDRLAPLVDFFSVGTNDLTQYTLACDRQNPRLERFCDTHHEAVLRLIEFAAQNAHRHGAWIGICGELASDTALTREFLRMGIDELSVSPSYVLRLRDTVRKIDLSKE